MTLSLFAQTVRQDNPLALQILEIFQVLFVIDPGEAGDKKLDLKARLFQVKASFAHTKLAGDSGNLNVFWQLLMQAFSAFPASCKGRVFFNLVIAPLKEEVFFTGLLSLFPDLLAKGFYNRGSAGSPNTVNRPAAAIFKKTAILRAVIIRRIADPQPRMRVDL